MKSAQEPISVQQAVTDYVNDNNTTKEALAKELGFGRSAFFMKLRGAGEFSLPEAWGLSRKLGCTLDEFYEMTQVA